MSYDVWLTIDTGGEEPATVAEPGNMTSNVAPVWRAVGADVSEFDGKLATDCIAKVGWALIKLKAAPRAFDHLVRGDGNWGTVESAIDFLERLDRDFRAHPKATVVVSW
jgi:hypothetical protein